jgi:uncharacterized protein (TIGR02678 family)
VSEATQSSTSRKTAAIESAEQRRAMRAILMRPLLHASADEEDEFLLVRRHAASLRRWFHHYTGWSLTVDGELARLRKVPAELGDSTRPARQSSGLPFSRRCYVLLCLALEALEKSERQTVLGRIADAILEAVATDPQLSSRVALTLATREERTDLVAVVRLLLDLKILRRVHGDEQQYVGGGGDVLYSVNRAALATLLATRASPAGVQAPDLATRLAEVTRELYADTVDDANARIRHGLYRRLLDDPVVYYADLTPEELTYFHAQRHAIVENIAEATGLVAEVRKEGVALVDPEDDLTDVRMPEEGTNGHFTLLLAEFLADRQRQRPVGEAVGEAEILRHAAELVERFGAYWRKEAREPGGEKELARQALERLSALRLARCVDGAILPLPAVARYATTEALFKGSAPNNPSPEGSAR